MTLFMIILARRLGTEEFGVYSSILAFIAFFSLVEEFGLNAPMIRRIARHRDRGAIILGEVFGVKAALGIAAYVMLIVTAIGLGVSPGITAILGLSMIFEILALTVTRAFEAYERMKDVAIITILERALLCLTGVAAVYYGGSLVYVSLAYLFTFACSLILAVTMFKRKVAPFRPRYSRETWKPMLREAVPFLISSILSIVWTRVDIYYLASFRTAAEIGWYTAALRVVEAQIFIPVAILGSVFPVLSRLQGESASGFNRILVKNFVFLLGLGAVIAGATYVFSSEIISLLFGDLYHESAGMLRIFSPMIVFSFLNYLFSGALIAMGRELLATYTTGTAAVPGFRISPGGMPLRAIKFSRGRISVQAILLWLILKHRPGRSVDPKTFNSMNFRQTGEL